MSDTIDLLETIGKSATLRYASADDLASVLASAGASEALKAAVAASDSQLLATELGSKPMQAMNDIHTTPHEEPDPDEGDDDEDGDDAPIKPDTASRD